MKALPSGWDKAAHTSWLTGDKPGAIASSIAAMNTRRTRALVLQVGYYLFYFGDFRAAAHLLEQALRTYPEDREILLNIVIAHAKAKQHEPAARYVEEYVRLGGTDPVCFAALCSAFKAAGDEVQAKAYGERALETAAAISGRGPELNLAPTPDAAKKRRIITFSLWGNNPRYLRGALHNASLASHIYPGWTCRFLVDLSVDGTFVDALREAGAEVVVDPNTDLPQRLCRRFNVSDDPEVGLFISRDCDSIISEREALAVAEWIDSGKRFHVMRDWWTHNDLMLAGMWGGTAGAIPAITTLIKTYRPRLIETPHWDQWFLRDTVWPLIRSEVLVHDRFFDSFGARRFPGAIPAGGRHIGENEYSRRSLEQAAHLAPGRDRLPMLSLSTPGPFLKDPGAQQ